MQYEKRNNNNGLYFSFVWYDVRTKKRIRLTRAEIKKRFGHDITTEDEAEECLKLLEAQYETEKIKIERRLTWEKEYYNFAKLLDQYEKVQKKSAPNSWQNSVFYMKHYVLPFFLTQKKLNNIELWEDNFDEFRDWLERKARKIRSGDLISYSSKNHAIKSLNTFLTHLYQKKLIHRVTKCDSFGAHLINKRTLDDVVYPHEMEAVYQKLIDQGHKQEAIYFRFLFFSGMRLSEGLAISIADIFQGELPGNQLLSKKLKIHNIKYYGYRVHARSLAQSGGVQMVHGSSEDPRLNAFCGGISMLQHDGDQVTESFADLMGADVLSEYVANNLPKLDQEHIRLGYSNTFRWACDALQYASRANGRSWDQDVHLSTPDRINRIVIANARVRSEMGCKQPSKYKDCSNLITVPGGNDLGQQKSGSVR